MNEKTFIVDKLKKEYFTGILLNPKLNFENNFLDLKGYYIVSLTKSNVIDYEKIVGFEYDEKENPNFLKKIELNLYREHDYIDSCKTFIIDGHEKQKTSVHFLKISKNTLQTKHYHPDDRCGIVYDGFGVLRLYDEKNNKETDIQLEKNTVFYINRNVYHCFITNNIYDLCVLSIHPYTNIVNELNKVMIDNTLF